LDFEERQMQTLTPKQAQVCELVALGWSNKEIAAKLGIEPRTVEGHRASVYDKMGVRNAVELVRKMLGATV
jgi:two-component system response regulator DctR